MKIHKRKKKFSPSNFILKTTKSNRKLGYLSQRGVMSPKKKVSTFSGFPGLDIFSKSSSSSSYEPPPEAPPEPGPDLEELVEELIEEVPPLAPRIKAPVVPMAPEEFFRTPEIITRVPDGGGLLTNPLVLGGVGVALALPLLIKLIL